MKNCEDLLGEALTIRLRTCQAEGTSNMGLGCETNFQIEGGNIHHGTCLGKTGSSWEIGASSSRGSREKKKKRMHKAEKRSNPQTVLRKA